MLIFVKLVCSNIDIDDVDDETAEKNMDRVKRGVHIIDAARMLDHGETVCNSLINNKKKKNETFDEEIFDDYYSLSRDQYKFFVLLVVVLVIFIFAICIAYFFAKYNQIMKLDSL